VENLERSQSMSGDNLTAPIQQEPAALLSALRESEILRELAALLASSLDLDHILRILVKRATEVCEVERCSVWLLEDIRGTLRPKTYHLTTNRVDQKTIEVADALWYHSSLSIEVPAIQQLLKEGMLYIEDICNEPGLQYIAKTFLVRSALFVALIREGRPLGMLTLDNPDKNRVFSPEIQRLARAIGQQAAIAIDNARLYQQAQAEKQRAEQLIERARSVYKVALTVNASEDLATIFSVAMDHLIKGLGADSGTIALLDSDTLWVVSSTDKQQGVQQSQMTAQLSSLPNCRHAATTGKPLYVAEEQVEGDEIHWYRKLDLHNTMIVPLMLGVNYTDEQQGDVEELPPGARCVGLVFVNYLRNNFQPTKGQFAYAQDIAAQCALAVEKVDLLADVRQSARLANERAKTLDAIFHAMTEGITVTNLAGEVLVLNNAAARFLGVPKNFKDDLISFLRRFPPYSLQGQPLDENNFPLVRALHGERIRNERFISNRADGEDRVLEVNIAPLYDSLSQQIGVVSAFRDITEQIQVEQRIRQALDTLLHVAEAVSGLSDIKDILQIVLERTLVTLNCNRGGVFIYDAEQDVFSPLFTTGFTQEEEEHWLADQQRWLNPELEVYTGFRQQLINGHATLVNAEQCPMPTELFQDFMVLAAPIQYNKHVHGVLLLDRSILPSAGEHTNQQGLTEFTIWDIAVIEGIAQMAGLALEQARWQAEAITARANEEAMREANALKDEFLAITAHEFRSPLTVILAQAQLVGRGLNRLKEQGQVKQSETLQKAIENLSVIEEQTRQLTNIVKTFLEVTYINRGQLVLSLEEVDLAKIAQQVVNDRAGVSINHTITCSIEPDPRGYLVQGDSARLHQILANLVENAIKYSPLGGPITVNLRRCEVGQQVPSIEVSVEDEGIGVPLDAQPHLFERFYRGPNISGNKTKGIGLGLYVVAQLLKLHGGSIRVESSGVYGEGSRFIFTLPALQKE